MADLLLLPLDGYQKEQNVARGVKRGAASFVRNVSLETMSLSKRMAEGAQVILEFVEDVVSGMYVCMLCMFCIYVCYVCMYTCMYVRYVCMYLCTLCMYVCVYVCMQVWIMDGWMCICMHANVCGLYESR